MTLSPSPSRFIILAYATDSIIVDTIPYEALTNINYSFLTPKAEGTFNPLNNGWKLKQIAKTARQHNVSVNISVGGWGWDAQFEEMAANPESRRAFVRNLKAFVAEYQLDGVDVDWEYPDPGQSSQNFLSLIKELRAALPDKLLTTAVISYGDEYGLGIPSESFELFDFVNVMAYDGPDHGTMEQFEKGLSYWSGRGLPKEKIIIGVPFYGAPNMPFFKIVEADPKAAQMDTFDYHGKTYHYNGIPTIQAKTRIAMKKAGGLMFWALDHDAQGGLSLVHAIHQTVHRP
ncbi:MAG TPA: glycosyl hydrolase family 18 protein [Anaerolineales bacterium]|nr:glycosyl hydrolase family 18 protein [Anaerolineales bacterium]HLO33833.1 glycosyl hydrolase family 18 protein [Anaerolineales bacterium]